MRTRYTLHLALLLVLLSAAYGLFQARAFIQGPRLTVTSPQSGETIRDDLLVIHGSVKNSNEVRINGRTIATDTSGAFTETLVTPAGMGDILVEARDRFGRSVDERFMVLGTRTPGESTYAEDISL